MPTELKLAIVFVIVGLSNIFLRNNRNWIFGYRSPRAIKSHERFALATLLYGLGLLFIGLFYLIVLLFDPELYYAISQKAHLIFVTAYFILLFLVIELRLHRRFRN